MNDRQRTDMIGKRRNHRSVFAECWLSPDYRACPTLRMLLRPSLAFRVQVWLNARVAKNRMHQYKQESNALLVQDRTSHCRDVIAVSKLHPDPGK